MIVILAAALRQGMLAIGLVVALAALAPFQALAADLASARAMAGLDTHSLLQRLYGDGQPRRLWNDDQARQALSALRAAPTHGLDPDDYDIAGLETRFGDQHGAGADGFDRALSTAMLAFLTHLRYGRTQPDIALPPQEPGPLPFDPADYLRAALQQQQPLELAIDAAAPPIPLYRRVQASLQQYRDLAAAAPAWRAPAQLRPGAELRLGKAAPGLRLVRQRLILLGDLEPQASVADPDQYSPQLARAIRAFQSRHGLAETGKPGPQTLAALAVPLSHRVRQLELTLERLRWIPPLRPGRVIVVNVAAYRLWAFDTTADSSAEPLEMRVIVGNAARTPTPLFIGQMRYLEFNPYWNVPRSIALGEIVPRLARNSGYLKQQRMELVSPDGKVQRMPAHAALAELRAGTVRVRQTPGAHNVLGAVKFAMPNPMNIYLHSTSAKELFGKARRDLSHGCIRVERPEALAAFVLADQPQWQGPAIAAAMAPGPVRTVRLSESIPVVLFYATAATDRQGRTLFAEDIYQRDNKLMRAMRAN
ncbi:L,D-transpeptidase family protein [Massilia soli]|uniref:L,D-transpeptidase family protein n=1 Tax=Massilia soli TaxID=2792854 RepID=A0ABS7SUY6_9BURK|nr:L,D-transpeptidase family protein [Massilia soli]MBZ2209758.1 L,D-transpeptidase family protein [Massilia soli]